MIHIRRILVLISLVLLTACGNKGGGAAVSYPTVVSGVASKGLIINGTVKVFALLADGSKGVLLGTGTTDSNGAYSVSIGNYSGPVVVEASGNYTDEATGQTMSVPASAPLQGALPNAAGAVTLAVTPLTDLAVRQAGTLTSNNISAANELVSEAFKIDIITTIPAAPTAAAFQSSTTTQEQKDYALALAAVSQQMQTSGNNLATTLANLNSGISSSGMSPQTAATLSEAATNFIANPNNLTSVTSIANSSVQEVGSTAWKLTAVLEGSAAASVKGIQATITLPTGASVRTDAAGKLLDGMIAATGSAANGSLAANYIPAAASSPAKVIIALMSSTNLSAGNVIILKVDMAPGSTTPSAGSFAITPSKLVGTGGSTVSGASLTAANIVTIPWRESR